MSFEKRCNYTHTHRVMLDNFWCYHYCNDTEKNLKEIYLIFTLILSKVMKKLLKYVEIVSVVNKCCF